MFLPGRWTSICVSDWPSLLASAQLCLRIGSSLGLDPQYLFWLLVLIRITGTWWSSTEEISMNPTGDFSTVFIGLQTLRMPTWPSFRNHSAALSSPRSDSILETAASWAKSPWTWWAGEFRLNSVHSDLGGNQYSGLSCEWLWYYLMLWSKNWISQTFPSLVLRRLSSSFS